MSYQAAHTRMRRTQGAASKYTCPCGSPAHHWAYQGSAEEKVDSKYGWRYSDNPADYMAMCALCHSRLDSSRTSHCAKGHELSRENLFEEHGRRRCRVCRREKTKLGCRRRRLDPDYRAKLAAAERARRARIKAAKDAA